MLLIGDVSGKGISAALLVSMVKYVLKANAPWNASPAQLLTVANRLLATDMGSEMFVTMFAARYNPRTGRLRYTSAGHDPCYVCRREGSPATVVLNSRGPVLGVFPEIELTDGEATLREGDVLLLYTDGLVNVRCHGRMPENSRRLCSHVRNAMAQPAEQIVQALLHDATEGCEPTDDITVLLLKREGAATA
jgi:sigma-B regulation protein RsbU (phosphoserine phosphatase)